MAKKNQVREYRTYLKVLWMLAGAMVLAVFLCVGLAAMGVFGKLPPVELLENPKSKLASEIITTDGKILGKFYQENRTHTEYNQLSPALVNALVATEDERFYEHSGVDFKALARAVINLGSDGGGSTITQQLAKQLFHKPARTITERIVQKFKEWVIAARLERLYTKEDIIAMYFNQFDFLYQAVGINSAAKIYFNSTPDSLTIEQAAILVGMAKNPSLYNPVRDSTLMKNRRNTVYYQMLRNEMISREQYDTLKLRPMVVNFSRESHLEGLAPYFREYLRKYMADWIKQRMEETGEDYSLYTDGLKIYTTIDSRMQSHAEEAVNQHFSNLQRVFFLKEDKRKQAPFHNLTDDQIDRILTQAMKRTPRYRSLRKAEVSMDSILQVFNAPRPMSIFSWKGDIDTVLSPMDSIRYYKHFYQGGLISVEPQTGFVKAWVGGIDYKHFKYDHVKQGRRQVGSTFKPFVYATAIKQKQYSPCMEVPNVRTCIEKGQYGLLEDWCPKNSDDEYGGVYSLKYALANSVNTVTTYLMKQVGPDPVIRMCREMGIEAEIPKQPSIALGTVDLSVYEMVGSYTALANKGVYTQPIMITRIENKDGIVLEDFSPRTNEVMSEEDAYVIVNLMKGVTSGGTGIRLRTTGGRYPNDVVTGYPYDFQNPIAGKTGTTQNQSDGWFMGMVPNLITGVWGGCEDRSAHFGSITYGQGATVSLPVWALYMKMCYEDPHLNVSKADFDKPDKPLKVELDCDNYQGSGSTEFEDDNIPDQFDL